MKDFDEILEEKRVRVYGAMRGRILQAMREACEQAIDECADSAKPTRYSLGEVDKASILNVKKLLK